MNGDAVCRRLAGLVGMRAQHEARWRDCFDVTWVERADYFWNNPGVSSSDQAKRAELVDSTAADAAELLAAGMVGGLVPSNMQWFDLDTGDPDRVQANDWLSEAARFLWTAIHASNFDGVVMDLFADAVGAGWCVQYCEEDDQAGGPRFEWWPVGQCFVAASRAGGMIDIVYRRYSLTVEQCVEKWGLEKVSATVRRKYEAGGQSLADAVQLVHAIEPRRKAMPGSRMARDLPFASYHVEVGSKHMLSESGYHEFPCSVPRWRMIPGSAYAVGPVAKILPDAKSLNRLATTELQAADLDVGGLWKARDDGVLNPNSVRIGPRRVVAVADMDNFERLDTGAGRTGQRAWTTKSDLQAQIRRSMRSDYLEPQDKPQMTAYEVHVRVHVIRQLLGPDFGRFQSEYLQPTIARVLGLAMRAGVLPPLPDGLESYSIQYKSPLARAQQAEDAEATRGYVDWLSNLATVKQDASVFDPVDLDKASRHIATGSGVPTDILRDPDEILEVRKAREEAAQQAQQDEQQQQMQMMAADAASKRVAAGA